MTHYKSTLAEVKRSAEKELGQFVMRDGNVRSFHFHGHYTDRKVSKPIVVAPYPFGKVVAPIEYAAFAYNSNYNFTLTWTPGKLHLSGDIGELTLTHYHAMPTLDEAIKWARSSDFDYLLGKSDKRKTFDPEGTASFIWSQAIEPILDHITGNARMISKPGERYKWGRKLDGGGQISELRAWRAATVAPEDPEAAAEGDFDYDTEEQKQRDRPDYLRHEFERGKQGDFALMIRLYEQLNFYQPDFDDIFLAANRRKLRRELPYHLEHHHQAAEFCSQLGMEDYYGSEEWGRHEMFQIAAIQHGCRMIAQSLWPKSKFAEAAE